MENLQPVLLVEDDDIDQEAVQRAMKKLAIPNPLHIAADGIEALELLRGNGGQAAICPSPCVILLDINMQRMNGIELLRVLRGDQVLKQNVVFMLTTSARTEDIQACYEASVAGYMLKDDLSQFMLLLRDYFDVNQTSYSQTAERDIFLP